MTTRNFRVNNGLEVGDIVISASANTITGGATAAPSADGQFANKKYVDDQAAATLTLTNKTLTAPKIADAGFIADANGNELLIFQTTASAVNQFDITNNASGSDPIISATGGDTNIGIAITAKGAGDIALNAGADVNIPADKGLTFGNDGEKIEGDGTDLTIASSNLLNLTATTDVAIPANVGLLFGTGEKIEGDNTDLTITSGAKINLAATSDVHLANNIGLVFGDAAEKIEGDGTDLTITGNNIKLTAATDVILPINVGLHFTDANEKIESNGTNLTITAASGVIALAPNTDVTLPNDKGLIFGDAGEKIEGDGTDLTIASSNLLNLTATTDVAIPANVGLLFGTGEKIEGDNTDLTVTSGAKINLTAVSDVHIPKNVGIVFDDNASEKIESNDTDLTVNSGGKINLTATTDVHIPNAVGIVFGDAGEKIEGDGTDLLISSSGTATITATGSTVVTNNLTVGGNLDVTGTLDLSDSNFTNVGSLQLDSIAGDGDTNTSITFSGSDVITIATGGAGRLTIGDGALTPVTDDQIDLGTASLEFKNAFFDGTVTSDAFAGPLTGNVTGTADVATAVTAADESSDTSCNVLFVTAATGDLPPKTGTNLTFNSSSGVLTATGFAGALTGDVTGNADTATVGTTVTVSDNESTNESNVILFAAGAAGSGNLGVEADGNMTYNPSTGKITATGFVGDLTGTASAAQYSDVAERFASDSVYAPGTVVALGGAEEITQVNEEASDEVFGVVSSLKQAAFKMNAGAGSDDSHPFIAMTGRVDVKVIGTVNKGDRLVSASVPGYARAATKAECTAFNVIGRALTGKTEAGQGSVLAAVRVSH